LTRFRATVLLTALIALSATLAACGGGGSSASNDPKQILDEATLKGVESGKLNIWGELGILAPRYGHVFFRVVGPFQSEAESELPELDLRMRVNGSINGERIDFKGGLTLLSNRAYVGYSGTEYEVDPTTFNFVKSAIKKEAGKQEKSGEDANGCREAASEIKFSDFVDGLKDEGKETLEGTEISRITGNLDVSGAVGALIELIEDPACSEQLSAAGRLPSASELKRNERKVEEAIKGAQVEVRVGDDHIVRGFSIQAPTIVPPKQDSGAGGPERLGFELNFSLTGVNEEQTIEAPQNPKPLSQLFLELGINPIELAGALSGEGLSGAGGLGGLVEKLDGAIGGASGAGGGGSSGGPGGGQQAYLECLQEAHTATDVQGCARLLK